MKDVDRAEVADPVLKQLIEECQSRSDSVGLVLSGSRGFGAGDEESDYDLLWILTDPAFEARGNTDNEARTVGARSVEVVWASPAELQRLIETPGWWTYGYATSQVLVDKTGDVQRFVKQTAVVPKENAAADVAELFDGYLNGFYRSLKAARRQNELGSRLQAAESIIYLVRCLFALKQGWPPYHDRLDRALDALLGQGWYPGELQDRFLEIMRTGSPERQVELEERVEALLRQSGYGHVVEAWNGEIERVKGLVAPANPGASAQRGTL